MIVSIEHTRLASPLDRRLRAEQARALLALLAGPPLQDDAHSRDQ